jgi:hypothetical protein
MPYERRTLECRIAEDVVGMFVGVDDIADRLAGDPTNRGKQCPTYFYAATGVDNRNRIASDDDAKIRDITAIARLCERDLSEMCIDTISDWVDQEFSMLRCTIDRGQTSADRNECSEQKGPKV